jgi:hypothetical protein
MVVISIKIQFVRNRGNLYHMLNAQNANARGNLQISLGRRMAFMPRQSMKSIGVVTTFLNRGWGYFHTVENFST